MTKLYGYMIGCGLIAAVLLGIYWRGHSAGYDSGYAVGDKDHKAIAAERDKALADKASAEASASLWQGTLTKLQETVEAEKAAADAQRAAGERALAQAQADQVRAEQSRIAWQAKYDDALKTPDCAAQRKMTLCPALQSY